MLTRIRELQKRLQASKIKQFRRRLPLGELITDRHDNAREYDFGEGTTCYDSAVILGDVTVGRHTWIGPNTVLDGSGAPLLIGDFCSISAGVQIYTHDTVRWCSSLGQADFDRAATTIGSGVYIGPNSIVAKGVTIGDGAVIGAMSFVNSDIPGGTKAWGQPARAIGPADRGTP